MCIGIPAEEPGQLLVAAGMGVYTDRIGTRFPIEGSVYADAIIRQLRAAIFTLHPEDPPPPGANPAA